MAYKHGVYIEELPTSIVPPVKVESAVPIYFVTAPIHLSKEPYNVTNEPKLLYTYKEAVTNFGYSTNDEIWDNYTSNEVINAHFVLYGVAPIVVVNVLDPTKHIEVCTNVSVNSKDGVCILKVPGVLIDTVIVDDENAVVTGFNDDGYVVIATELEQVKLSFTKLDPSLVTVADIIGGFDVNTNKNKGLELIDEIYGRFRINVTQIVAPSFSESPTVAMIMDSKSSNINGCFNAVNIIDLPTKKDNKTLIYTDIPKLKNDNNLLSNRQIACYPKVALDDKVYSLSTHIACLNMVTDNQNNGTPYASMSNKKLQANRLVIDKEEQIVLTNEQANYLNGNGVVSAINFINGFTAWGNRTTIYPSSTDVKDTTIPIRRMMDFIGNTLVNTYWSKVDSPITKRSLDSIIDSGNIWLNSLVSSGYILGGSMKLSDDTSILDLMDGTIAIDVKATPPSAMREIDFRIEYDPDALITLFS